MFKNVILNVIKILIPKTSLKIRCKVNVSPESQKEKMKSLCSMDFYFAIIYILYFGAPNNIFF